MPNSIAILSIYLITIWLITFLIFRLDKNRARSKHKRRVSERTLLQLSFIGGWPTALLARHLFRHKTAKQPFSTYLNIISIGQTAILFTAWVLFF